jgi:broad specificity phosphatase PhoE
MSTVILVRHALPEVHQGTSSKLWGLGESAREDCVLLAYALPPGIPRIISSDERKARETADVLGLRLGVQVEVDPRFQEVDRPQVWDRDYREVAAGYLSGIHEPGWESQGSVVDRFRAGIEQATDTFGEDIVVVNHGLAMSLWVASAVSIDLVPWWKALTFPDAWRVDVPAGTVEHLWLGGRAGD